MKTIKINVIDSVGIDIDEVFNQQHNIWIGISFYNKLFTLENIASMIEFALTYTKQKVLVWIPGRMHAINYFYFEKISRANALKQAFSDEDKFKQELKTIIDKLSLNQQQKIVISDYDECLSPQMIKRRELFYREFAQQNKFYNEIMDIAIEILNSRGRKFDKRRAEALSLYVLQELPAFFGIQTIFESTVYTAMIYPGFGKLDYLVKNIIECIKYPDLTKKLFLQAKSGIIDIKFNKITSNDDRNN